MDRVIIDTHILVSLFIENNPYFEKAKTLVKDKTIYIPINVVLEFIFLTTRGLKVDENIIWKKLEEIHDNVIILPIHEKDLLEAYILLKNHNKSLKNINDALILVIAKRLKLSILTFDDKLKNLAKKIGVKVLP